jgi:hypothetical protein
MRIVMPLFAFNYRDSQEFVFEEGKYALREFIADNEMPSIEGLSKLDVSYMEEEHWALVAENPDLSKYKEEINLLLLSFKICKPTSLFIKYRLLQIRDFPAYWKWMLFRTELTMPYILCIEVSVRKK